MAYGGQPFVPNAAGQLDILGQQDMAVPQDVQSFIQELLAPRGNQYAPQAPPEEPYQGNEDVDEPYQVAGDVVKFPPRLEPGQIPDDEYLMAKIMQEWQSMVDKGNRPSGQIIKFPRIPRR